MLRRIAPDTPAPCSRTRRPFALTAILAAFAMVHAAPAAVAVDLVPPDPWQMIHKVRALGPAEVGRDDFRDPLITADLAGDDGNPIGLPYEVVFYGCWMGRECTAILLTLRLSREEWEDEPPEPDALAEWNGTKLIGRAWLDEQNRAVLDHAVVIGPGIADETLSETLSAWATAMREFAEHLDFPMD